jgi:hypothetical protein
MPSKSKRLDKDPNKNSNMKDLDKFMRELAAANKAKKAKQANAPISVESRLLAEEDPRARAKRANATSGMKHGGKVKGRAGGYKSGGKVRGCGIAKKGTRKAKML